MKRFEIDIDNLLTIWDNKENVRYEIDDIEKILNDFFNEIQRLNKVIDLMEYQMKVQDRIIKDYEDGDYNGL